MTINPLGLQKPFDFGLPESVSAAAGGVISGGQFVYLISGTSQAVGSGLASFAASDLLVAAPASGTNWPFGLAAYNSASGTNNYVQVFKRCTALLNTADNLTAGDFVTIGTGVNAVELMVSGTNHPQLQKKIEVGRAMTSAASGTNNYVLVSVHIP